MKDALGSVKRPSGWWDVIRMGGGGNHGARDDREHPPAASVFLLRNYPETMGYFEHDPCLERHDRLPQTVIPMAEGMGVSLQLEIGGRAITQRELETQLQFAGNAFQNVEIISGDAAQLGWIISPIKKVLPSLNQSSSQRIFIDVSLKRLDVSQALELVHNIAGVRGLAGHVGIQISDWENNSPGGGMILLKQLENLIEQGQMQNVKIGLVIGGNCATATQEGHHHHHPRKTIFLLRFSHFVCDSSGLVIDYKYEMTAPHKYFRAMSTLLDGQLYTKVSLSQAFLEKKVYIRLQIRASHAEEDYLRIVRDLNQHSELYKVNYFAINAFVLDKEEEEKVRGGGSKKELGWWRMNMKNNLTEELLSNPSSYTNLESDYLNIPMWSPSRNVYHTKTVTFSKVGLIAWITVPICGVLITLLIAAIVVVGWRRRKRYFLTEAEVKEFLEGKKPRCNFNALHNNNYLGMKFDKRFEISKVDLTSGTNQILGMGNFGTVYKATVKGTLVAVKVPLVDGGSKTEFKASIQEIKILAHVGGVGVGGSHPNVLAFVGAYVREIGRGVVQIATELCENGTLLAHLRTFKQTVSSATQGNRNSSSSYHFVQQLHLERFCYEIASGMEYLSGKQVIHGDLAARNILLDANFICKIGDFGLSRKLYEYEKYVKSSQEPLPWRWLAVESLDRMEFSSKSDVWSYGVTVWEIYSLGGAPYPGLAWSVNYVDELKSGLRLQKPEYSTNELYWTMLECWNLEPGQRPTFSELCNIFRDIKSRDYTILYEEEEEEEEEG